MKLKPKKAVSQFLQRFEGKVTKLNRIDGQESVCYQLTEPISKIVTMQDTPVSKAPAFVVPTREKTPVRVLYTSFDTAMAIVNNKSITSFASPYELASTNTGSFAAKSTYNQLNTHLKQFLERNPYLVQPADVFNNQLVTHSQILPQIHSPSVDLGS